MKDHNFIESEIEKETNKQLNLGFLWIEDIVAELENYDEQRGIYPTLESYMPKIIQAYDRYAKNIDVYKQRLDERRPKVISINEFSNYDQNVNPALKTMTINFDKPLIGEGYSINYGDRAKTVAFPKFINLKYSEDKKTILIEWKLESKKEYQFILSGVCFKSEEGISMKDYEIYFKTK